MAYYFDIHNNNNPFEREPPKNPKCNLSIFQQLKARTHNILALAMAMARLCDGAMAMAMTIAHYVPSGNTWTEYFVIIHISLI